jgi:hypothetical protein
MKASQAIILCQQMAHAAVKSALSIVAVTELCVEVARVKLMLSWKPGEVTQTLIAMPGTQPGTTGWYLRGEWVAHFTKSADVWSQTYKRMEEQKWWEAVASKSMNQQRVNAVSPFGDQRKASNLMHMISTAWTSAGANDA